MRNQLIKNCCLVIILLFYSSNVFTQTSRNESHKKTDREMYDYQDIVNSVTYLYSQIENDPVTLSEVLTVTDNFGTNTCLNNIRSAKVYALLKIGDDSYTFGKGQFFTLNIGVTVDAQDENGGGIDDDYQDLSIEVTYDQNTGQYITKPEQLVLFDLDLDDLDNNGIRKFQFTIENENINFDSNLPTEFKDKIKDNIYLEVFYTLEDKMIPRIYNGTQYTGESIIVLLAPHKYADESYAINTDDDGGPVRFEWKLTTDCMKDKIPNFQIQILKLYNKNPDITNPDIWNNTFKADVDWSKALTIETGNTNVIVDAADNINSYYQDVILTEGAGYYIWRVRPIGNYFDGGIADDRNWGVWSSSVYMWNTEDIADANIPVYEFDMTNTSTECRAVFFYDQFDPYINWKHIRYYSEDDYLGTRFVDEISHADNLLHVRQTKRKLPSKDVAVVSENILDFSGRAVVQTLPVPYRDGMKYYFNNTVTGGIDLNYGFTGIGFKSGLLTHNSQNYEAANFDYNDGSTINDNDPEPATGGWINNYYDGDDLFSSPITSDENYDVPSAEGYPFSRVLYYSDGTNRIKEQSGFGEVHRIRPYIPPSDPAFAGELPPRTIRTHYSMATDDELIAIFGKEAPKASSVQKTMVTDQNQVTTISYQDKAGKTIAQCIIDDQGNWKTSGDEDPLLDNLGENVAQGYQGESSNLVEISGYTEIATNKYSTSKKISFTDLEPQNIEITYHIDPIICSLLVCETDLQFDKCTTVPFESEIFVTDNDREIEIGLIKDGVTVRTVTDTERDCESTEYPMDAPWVFKSHPNAGILSTDQISPPITNGTYEFKRVITIDADFKEEWLSEFEGHLRNTIIENTEDPTILDEVLAELNDETIEEISEFYDALDVLVAAHTGDGIIVKMEPATGEDWEPYYQLNLSCDAVIEIPILDCESLCIDLVYDDASDPDDVTYEEYLINKCQGLDDDIEGTLPFNLETDIRNYFFKGDGSTGVNALLYESVGDYETSANGAFNKLIENMLNDTHNGATAYDEETLCKRWTSIVDNYELLAFNYDEDGNKTGYNYDFNLLEAFLSSVGKHYKGVSNHPYGATPGSGEYGSGYLDYAHAYFLYTSDMHSIEDAKDDEKNCEMIHELTWEETATIPLWFTDNSAKDYIDDPTVQLFDANYETLKRWELFYNCVYTCETDDISTNANENYDNDESDASERPQLVLDISSNYEDNITGPLIYNVINLGCKRCEALENEIELQVKDLYREEGYYIEGDYYYNDIVNDELNYDIFSIETADAHNVKRKTGCEIGCMVSLIIADCKDNFYKQIMDNEGNLNDEVIENMLKALTYDFEISKPKSIFECENEDAKLLASENYTSSEYIADYMNEVLYEIKYNLPDLDSEDPDYNIYRYAGQVYENYKYFWRRMQDAGIDFGELIKIDELEKRNYLHLPTDKQDFENYCNGDSRYDFGYETFILFPFADKGSATPENQDSYDGRSIPVLYEGDQIEYYTSFEQGAMNHSDKEHIVDILRHWTIKELINDGTEREQLLWYPCGKKIPVDVCYICYNWIPPQEHTVTLEAKSCLDILRTHITGEIYSQVEEYVDDKLNEADALIEQELSTDNIVETFEVSWGQNYDAYTLYYYDRGGRLVKTIPPKGVKPVTSRSETPPHKMETIYHYNSLGELQYTKSPDENDPEYIDLDGDGTSEWELYETHYYYNNKGQIRFSQDARQKEYSPRRFSYIIYDYLGRATETGEAEQIVENDIEQHLDFDDLAKKLLPGNLPTLCNKIEYVQTVYSVAATLPAPYDTEEQKFLRNRVSYTLRENNVGTANDEVYTYYSYDPHGNVEWVIHQVPTGNTAIADGFVMNLVFKTDYEYNLINNNVNKVYYNKGRSDQFIHKYSYDEDNRLVKVETSRDDEFWDLDASYDYYLHGPLKRIELADDFIQGVDYTYTINGWLKGINHPDLDYDPAGGISSVLDPGQDASGIKTAGTLLGNKFATDGFGMILHYFKGDFVHINPAFMYNDSENAYYSLDENNLYNGNIAGWESGFSNEVAALSSNGDVMPSLNDLDRRSRYLFNYDILGRLKKADYQRFDDINSNDYWIDDAVESYGSQFEYDANGNITSLIRNGPYYVGSAEMDNLSLALENQTFNNEKNRLSTVYEVATPTISDFQDLPNPDLNTDPDHSYAYDAAGNLIAETVTGMQYEGIGNIEWTVDGKVKKITYNNDDYTEFLYDANGRRIKKKAYTDVDLSAGTYKAESDYYALNAAGDPMAIYKAYVDCDGTESRESAALGEWYIYGKKDHGRFARKLPIPETATDKNPNGLLAYTEDYPAVYGPAYTRQLEYKEYELKDHLANVRLVFSDLKLPWDDALYSYHGVGPFKLDFDNIRVVNNYYPFGMLRPRQYWQNDFRSFAVGQDGYRFGFNGMERDDDIKGEGNSYTTEFRMNSPRLGGRWWSQDPVVKPWESPYAGYGNNPIGFVDPSGNDYYWMAGFKRKIVYMCSDELSITKTKKYNAVFGEKTMYQNYFWMGETYEEALKTYDYFTETKYIFQEELGSTTLEQYLLEGDDGPGLKDFVDIGVLVVGSGTNIVIKVYDNDLFNKALSSGRLLSQSSIDNLKNGKFSGTLRYAKILNKLCTGFQIGSIIYDIATHKEDPIWGGMKIASTACSFLPGPGWIVSLCLSTTFSIVEYIMDKATYVFYGYTIEWGEKIELKFLMPARYLKACREWERENDKPFPFYSCFEYRKFMGMWLPTEWVRHLQKIRESKKCINEEAPREEFYGPVE